MREEGIRMIIALVVFFVSHLWGYYRGFKDGQGPLGLLYSSASTAKDEK